MSMQSEGNNAKGRNYHQTTRDGTGSAASVGTGGTGDIGAMGSESVGQGNQQSSRSDDLLAGDTTHQEADQAFSGGSQSGQVQTGMEGIGQGKRQSGQPGSQQSGQDQNRQGGQDSSQTDADQYDQGTAPRE
ncbi:hypothetical protein [Massilia sp. IC2-476]|uniref:hypothetical protein n=1 Tax=Massilia sp. IC2-476 TaxID=2887199 RepID=UPI001D11AC05|nr:hypothetical protein [Massilia sp. IC2-476]MCC2973813.1 hypothetical protein [Massilia sp. IC2-476]